MLRPLCLAGSTDGLKAFFQDRGLQLLHQGIALVRAQLPQPESQPYAYPFSRGADARDEEFKRWIESLPDTEELRPSDSEVDGGSSVVEPQSPLLEPPSTEEEGDDCSSQPLKAFLASFAAAVGSGSSSLLRRADSLKPCLREASKLLNRGITIVRAQFPQPEPPSHASKVASVDGEGVGLSPLQTSVAPSSTALASLLRRASGLKPLFTERGKRLLNGGALLVRAQLPQPELAPYAYPFSRGVDAREEEFKRWIDCTELETSVDGRETSGTLLFAKPPQFLLILFGAKEGDIRPKLSSMRRPAAATATAVLASSALCGAAGTLHLLTGSAAVVLAAWAGPRLLPGPLTALRSCSRALVQAARHWPEPVWLSGRVIAPVADEQPAQEAEEATDVSVRAPRSSVETATFVAASSITGFGLLQSLGLFLGGSTLVLAVPAAASALPRCLEASKRTRQRLLAQLQRHKLPRPSKERTRTLMSIAAGVAISSVVTAAGAAAVLQLAAGGSALALASAVGRGLIAEGKLGGLQREVEAKAAPLVSLVRRGASGAGRMAAAALRRSRGGLARLRRWRQGNAGAACECGATDSTEGVSESDELKLKVVVPAS